MLKNLNQDLKKKDQLKQVIFSKPSCSDNDVRPMLSLKIQLRAVWDLEKMPKKMRWTLHSKNSWFVSSASLAQHGKKMPLLDPNSAGNFNVPRFFRKKFHLETLFVA